MTLSIIIPVYKAQATLQRCVGSVLAQQADGLEVVLVDDGSPDECPRLCDEWARRDSRITVVHKANGGLSDARNHGIERARGECLTFVDADDFIAPDTYGPLMQLMEDRPQVDLLEFPVFWHYGTPQQTLRSFGNEEYADTDSYWLTARAYEHAYACNKIYRRQLFSEVRFPVGRVFEDIYTLPHLLARCKAVATTTQGCYYYCMQAGGITATAQGPQLQQLLESHLPVLQREAMRRDTRYYMHVLNIQADVCERTGQPPVLPRTVVNPLAAGLTPQARLKAVLLNLFGIKTLCRITQALHRMGSSR